MIVKTNQDVFNLETKEEVEQVIKNCMSHQFDDILIKGEEEYPCMTILLNGDLACVHYFFDDSKIYDSKGNRKKEVEFMVNGETEFFDGDSVIPATQAIKAAKEFVETMELPKSIQWNDGDGFFRSILNSFFD